MKVPKLGDLVRDRNIGKIGIVTKVKNNHTIVKWIDTLTWANYPHYTIEDLEVLS